MPYVSKCLAYSRKKVGLYAQAGANVGNSGRAAREMIVPRIIRLVIDEGLARGETGYLVRSALLLLGLGLVSAILNLGNRYWSEWIASRVGYDLRNRLARIER